MSPPLRDPHTARRLGIAQIHFAVLLAGGTGLFAKLVTVSPAAITTGRTIFGSLSLFLFARLTRTTLRLQSTRDLAALALTGVVLAIHWFTFFLSIQVSTVAIGLLAFSTFPLFTTFLEPLAFGERLRWQDLVTALVVTAGLVLITPAFDLHNHLTQGLLWGVLSAFTYAALALMNRSYSRKYPAVAVSFYQQAVAALCTLPVALLTSTTPTSRDLLLLVLLGVVFTALGQTLIVASLRHLRAQTASIIFGLEPVYGILLAWLLLGETPASHTLLGGTLICMSVVWASLSHR